VTSTSCVFGTDLDKSLVLLHFCSKMPGSARVDYRLTEAGRALDDALAALRAFGATYLVISHVDDPA